MPFIDLISTYKFEEDNFQDVFGQMLVDNGWTLAKTFYKAVVDTRCVYQITERVNYVVARHSIYRNADGKLLGLATLAKWSLSLLTRSEPIRRPGDNEDPNDENYGMTPSWDEWVIKKYLENVSRTNLYFYTLEKLPNQSIVQDNSIISMIVMPGMSGTSVDFSKYRDDVPFYFTVVPEYVERDDMKYEGRILSASFEFLTRAALDIEVLGTKWYPDLYTVEITDSDPRTMQSPIVVSSTRADFLEHISNPVWHTNWWTDSEIRIKGYVDSRTIFLVLQADNAPVWEHNLIPTIPLYFGRIVSLDGEKDEGYALFAGTIPPRRLNNNRNEVTYNVHFDIYPNTTVIVVADGSKLPEPPALLTIGGKEIVKLVAKDGNVITVEREQQGTVAEVRYSVGTPIARLSANNNEVDKEKIISLYDFDDPGAKIGEIIFPLLKLYPYHPSNGLDSVLVTRSKYGARYQAHYLSWNAPTNQIPPVRMTGDGRKYPRAYNSLENTHNYKYQFNTSKYSGKVHSSRIFVVHPEEGVRGYLDRAIAFDAQGINASSLRVRKQDCPGKVYEIYRYMEIGAVSPLTKRPATPFRPVGLGIYVEDHDPNAPEYDPTTDTTPPQNVTITKAESTQSQIIDIEFTLPADKDLSHLEIYVDGQLYAKGVTGVNNYRIVGLTTNTTPEIKVVSVDLAGNKSSGVIAPQVQVK